MMRDKMTLEERGANMYRCIDCGELIPFRGMCDKCWKEFIVLLFQKAVR